MSFSTITAAQRLEIRDSVVQAAAATQPFAQNGLAPTAAELALITPVLDNCAAALTVAGSTGLPATSAVVSNAGSVAVVNSASADSHNATATVAAGALTNVKLAATVAMVDNADAITMQNSAGTAIAGTHPATVTAGVVANVKLAATVAAVSNGVKVNAVSVTGSGNFATFTVANGVITAIVLSAS